MYRKSTANKRIILHKANTPLPHRLAALSTYINRALHDCSTEKIINRIMKNIENIGLNAERPPKNNK